MLPFNRSRTQPRASRSWNFSGMEYSNTKRKPQFIGNVILAGILVSLCIVTLKQSSGISGPSPFSHHEPGVTHVLVTRGAGYIGSHAVLQLLKDSYQVTVVPRIFVLLRRCLFDNGDEARRNSWPQRFMKRNTMNWWISTPLGCVYWKWSPLNTHIVNAHIRLRSTRKSYLIYSIVSLRKKKVNLEKAFCELGKEGLYFAKVSITMPTRQMKESSEQHLVFKSQLQNSMNTVQRLPKAIQNGSPPQEGQNAKHQQLCPSPAKNRSRRGKGGQESRLLDVSMHLSTQVCGFHGLDSMETRSGSVHNGGYVGDMEMDVPSLSKSLRFLLRPGQGQVGVKCMVKANHFLAEVPDKDLNHYDITITPEVASKSVNRAIMAELIKQYRKSDLGMRLPAYDGRKSLYTAGELPFISKEFKIKLVDEDDGFNDPKRERVYKVAIKFVQFCTIWDGFLAGKHVDVPQ